MVQIEDHEGFCQGLHCQACSDCLRRKDFRYCSMCVQEQRELKKEKQTDASYQG